MANFKYQVKTYKYSPTASLVSRVIAGIFAFAFFFGITLVINSIWLEGLIALGIGAVGALTKTFLLNNLLDKYAQKEFEGRLVNDSSFALEFISENPNLKDYVENVIRKNSLNLSLSSETAINPNSGKLIGKTLSFKTLPREDEKQKCANCGLKFDLSMACCPNCGEKIKEPVSGVRVFVVALLAVVVFLSIVYFVRQ